MKFGKIIVIMAIETIIIIVTRKPALAVALTSFAAFYLTLNFCLAVTYL